MPIFKKGKADSAARKSKASAAPLVGFVCLGCPKNQVNAERMMAALEAEGFRLTENPYAGADVVLVNTCGFIDEAKSEAIDAILAMVEQKKNGSVKHVIVTGCLSERYRDELHQELPEVDAVLGLGANDAIATHVRQVLQGAAEDVFPPLSCLHLSGARKHSGHWAWLQIADGCSHRCHFCAIPAIRGGYRSRPMEEILCEAESLAAQGVRELVLVAQDSTSYGLDLYGERRLPALLESLCQVEALRWVRVLYAYPDGVNDALMAVMAREPKIVKYLDLPLQHVDDGVLRAMGRPGNGQHVRDLLQTLRAQVPGIQIRTSLMTGYPGEDELAFERLSAFVEEQRFAHMGVFAFSPQEGTVAADLPDLLPLALAEERAEILQAQQARIADDLRRAAVGQHMEVMVDAFDAYNDVFVGRSATDAPEIDGSLVFTSSRDLQAGDMVDVEIVAVQDAQWVGRDLPLS